MLALFVQIHYCVCFIWMINIIHVRINYTILLFEYGRQVIWAEQINIYTCSIWVQKPGDTSWEQYNITCSIWGWSWYLTGRINVSNCLLYKWRFLANWLRTGFIKNKLFTWFCRLRLLPLVGFYSINRSNPIFSANGVQVMVVGAFACARPKFWEKLSVTVRKRCWI